MQKRRLPKQYMIDGGICHQAGEDSWDVARISVAEVAKTFGGAGFQRKNEILGEFRYIKTLIDAAFVELPAVSDVAQCVLSPTTQTFVIGVSTVHELSIANKLVEIVLEYVQNSGNERVQQINLRIGALSCVHRDALLFSFDVVAADTELAGAKLQITDLPVTIYCEKCHALRELLGVQSFLCPVCQSPSADIRQGQELDIESIVLAQVSSESPETVNSIITSS